MIRFVSLPNGKTYSLFIIDGQIKDISVQYLPRPSWERVERRIPVNGPVWRHVVREYHQEFG